MPEINDTDKYTVTTGFVRELVRNTKDALSAKADTDDLTQITLDSAYDANNHRIIMKNIVFDSIYPAAGKYGLAVFPETDVPDASSFSGDREWLLDWRPYLIDMKAYPGETAKHPVAELRKDNWLRKTDGSYATVCCVKATQIQALNGKKDTLYWKTGSAGDKVSATVPAAFDSSGNFVPDKFWEYIKANLATVNTKAGVTYGTPIEVKVYVGSNPYSYGNYTDYHIPAPWETTDTDLSVFIGREKDVYVVDGYADTTGNHMRGLCSKPLAVGPEKFDPEDFRLRRTGISPGPATTWGGKARCMFFNSVGSDDYTKGNAGTASTSIFYNNGTYPRTNLNQYTATSYCRACNSGGGTGSAVPVGEGGYHAFNAFLCSLEAAYGTRNLWTAAGFSEGVSSNYAASATNGGIIVDGNYKQWSASDVTIQGSSGNYSNQVNSAYSKFQCMEPQIAASIATEMGLAANATFKWNGGTWHYEKPSGLAGLKTLGEGSMNCRMYKLTDSKTVNSHTVQCNLVCALAEGVNPVGDIWWFVGGGAELVYSVTTASNRTAYKYAFYLEPDQSKWYNYGTSADSKEFHSDGSEFPTESLYKCIVGPGDYSGNTDLVTTGGTGTTYCRARTGYSPMRRVSGGDSSNKGECCYQYRSMDHETTAQLTVGLRTRRRLLFRGSAGNGLCSPRYLAAAYRPSNSSVSCGCSAQVLLA